ncbi:RING finger protein 141-like [Argonauta hians]
MGQNQSIPEAVSYLGIVQGKLTKQLDIIKKSAVLTYDEFLDSVNELNGTTAGFADRKGKQLRFSVCIGTDHTVLWKGTVRIRCQKINTRTMKVESSRLLNLREYVLLYKEITEQIASMNLSEQSGDSASSGTCSTSLLFKEVEQIGTSSEKDEEECCICMERKSEIILPCMHCFCEICIDSWNILHRTCPVCRANVQGSDDTWVLTERPDSTEYDSQLRGYLVGLADTVGDPQ